MIIVAATIPLKPGKREAFIREVQTPIAATLKEEGCLEYRLMAPTDRDDQLFFFERWTDREALARHSASDHLKVFAKVKEELDLVAGPSRMEVYDIA